MTLRGVVVRGDGRGRGLGFPTANVDPGREKLPVNGVYEVVVEAESLPPRRAVCNVGARPTVADSKGVFVEVHIPGFSGDLYGRTLTIIFKRKLRGEKKFASLDELRTQIARDVASLDAQ